MRALPQLPSPTGTAIVDPRAVLSPVQNRHRPDRGSYRWYPWLLLASTGLAGVFCVLYLTKPVIVTGSAASPVALPPAALVTPSKVASASSLSQADPRISPDAQSLPGETSRPQATNPRGMSSGDAKPYEETNLRVQHVLGAQGPAGDDLGRIVLDVPVLYRSRSLRWSPQEISKARQLMTGIASYQEKSRALREEGSQLLAAWNELIGGSIPTETLRADSPTLPANQGNGPSNGSGLDTIHSIEIDR